MIGNYFNAIRFLKNIGFSSEGFETAILYDDGNSVYYLDEEDRYCYLEKKHEGSYFEFIKRDVARKFIEIHGFESLVDLEEKIITAIDELQIPGEFEGTIKITLEYTDDGTQD